MVDVVVTGLGLTQLPPGLETHTTMVLLIIVPMFPQSSPSSGFHETTCAKEMLFLAAIELQVSPDFSAYGVHFRASGRQMVPDVGKSRQ